MLPLQFLGGVQFARPPSSRVSQEGCVKAGVAVVDLRVHEALHLVDDVPATQCGVVLDGSDPGYQRLVQVGLQLAGVGDQTVQKSEEKYQRLL